MALKWNQTCDESNEINVLVDNRWLATATLMWRSRLFDELSKSLSSEYICVLVCKCSSTVAQRCRQVVQTCLQVNTRILWAFKNASVSVRETNTKQSLTWLNCRLFAISDNLILKDYGLKAQDLSFSCYITSFQALPLVNISEYKWVGCIFCCSNNSNLNIGWGLHKDESYQKVKWKQQQDLIY